MRTDKDKCLLVDYIIAGRLRHKGLMGSFFASWVPPACLSSRFQLVFPLKASQHVFGITSPTFHHIDLDFISLPGSELEKKKLLLLVFSQQIRRAVQIKIKGKKSQEWNEDVLGQSVKHLLSGALGVVSM